MHRYLVKGFQILFETDSAAAQQKRHGITNAQKSRAPKFCSV